MSEVKLNLIDAQHILTGTIHGSVADRCVAALSAEPETISELEAALSRYNKPSDGAKHFASLRSGSEIDAEPWDAGLVIIDLAARIVATESTYSQPGPEGEVVYHDGTQLTDVAVPYRLPSDWLFVSSVEAYQWSCDRRRRQREANPPFDARAVLYGSPLLEFIINSPLRSAISDLESVLRSQNLDPDPVASSQVTHSDSVLRSEISDPEIANGAPAETSSFPNYDDPAYQALSQAITNSHANWLMTPRDDLRGRSPRDVLLEKRNFIDSDMDTRCWQWSLLGEGPPCLAPDSYAYRYAGFGTHEWVVYYDLVRHLLWSATGLRIEANRGSSPTVKEGVIVGSSEVDRYFDEHSKRGSSPTVREGAISATSATEGTDIKSAMAKLDQIKTEWLEHSDKYEGRVPAIIIDNERRRLPQAMSPAELIIDEDCECCRMMAMDAEMGFGPTFWHLDGCNMDDGFAFSTCLTIEEWEAENREREEFNRKFELEWAERKQRIARGEIVDDTTLSDPF